jgi:NMD protein affecting ribosome stability and mRNA decay
MKDAGDRTGGKDRARTMAERRTRSHQTPVSRRPAPPSDLTCCERCGLVFWRKTWRRSRRRTTHALLAGAAWGLCPACRQADSGQAFGRVLVLGDLTVTQREELRRRVANVCRRAAYTQPQRRLLDLRGVDGGLEVRTTSQKLAHRIAHEIEKAFGGRVSYEWSDRDGRLLARWEAGAVAARARHRDRR